MSVAVSEKSKTEQFSETTLQIINHAALALMMSIGHRTRPLRYDGRRCRRRQQPEIAEPRGLNERYVREWLGAMVTGGIVEYDAGSDSYRLPPEHAVCLTRASSPNNIAVTAQWVGGPRHRGRRGGRGVPPRARRAL